MPGKTRGREKLLNCDSCGRRLPRDKAVSYNQMVVYSTDLKNADDVRTSIRREFHYCPSCGKHRHIYERKARDAARRSERFGDRFSHTKAHGQRQDSNPRDNWASYEPGGAKSGNPRSYQQQGEEQASEAGEQSS